MLLLRIERRKELNQQKRRGIIYSVVAVLLLVAVFLIVWQVLGNSDTKISEPTFWENIGSYTRITLNIYRVNCVDATGKQYVFTVVDRVAFDQNVRKAID